MGAVEAIVDEGGSFRVGLEVEFVVFVDGGEDEDVIGGIEGW